MIKKIILKDFLSYENGTAEFDGSTVAVVGENGAGKSAFLESIPYAYFGMGRENMSGMSRIKGDGSHEVQVFTGDSTVIRRGRTTGGKGFVEVREDGELVAKGKEADAWIVDRLGMDADTYMLTAFFGLHDVRHDVLIRVLPSARLETMQKLAKCGPYRQMSQQAKLGFEAAQRAFETETARKEGAEAVIADDEQPRQGLSDAHKLLETYTERSKELKNERRELVVEEEKYQAFVRERERLGVERKSLRKDIEKLESEEEQLRDDIDIDSAAMKSKVDEKKQVVKKLSGIDIDALRAKVEGLQSKAARDVSMVALKRTAVDVGSESAACPLCGSAIAESMVSEWVSDIETLTAEIASVRAEAGSEKECIAEAEKLQRLADTLERDVKDFVEDLQKYDSRLSDVARELRVARDELGKKEARYIDLTEKLGAEYQGLQARLSEINDLLTDLSEMSGDTTGAMRQIKESLKRNEESRKTIALAEKAAEKARSEMSAYKLLRAAWSRYGIPLRLIHDLSADIESRASSVYQEFDNGTIEVREVEDRGKPGIEFYLIDRKGERTFNQLSAGEKVMFFVAVRVAIAQIVSETNNVSVDYLILDEAMGNLSPKRRDDLIRLINKVLRKVFPQVIMVSHTEMRDIFSQTIRISADNEVSKIEVV